MKKILFFFYLLLPLYVFGQYYNVKDYGAVGDKRLCTESIQRAIDAAAKAGGGHVIVPAGEYLSGPLFLRSNIVFEVGPGATIYFHNDIENTPTIEGSWEGIERKVYASLLTGLDLKNVTITGRGRIDGQGKTWWDAFWQTDALRTKLGIIEREPENPKGSSLKYPRPRMINLYRCENVEISGISITNSPAWTVHPVYCRNVNIQGISIVQPYESPNTDGINPESCNGVRISNCYVDCGDDCITLKSGYNEHGRNIGIPCENVVITNCTFAHGRSAVGIGSEMSGGVRNVTVMNCVFQGTLRGLRVKTGRGRGGIVENLLAIGIIMENLREGISIDMGYEGATDKKETVTEETPHFRNIRYSNIIGHNIEQAINVIGLPEAPPRDILLENIRMECKRGLVVNNVENLTLRNIELLSTVKKSAFNLVNGRNVVLENLSSSTLSDSYPMLKIEHIEKGIVKECIVPNHKGWFMQQSNCKEVEFLNNLLREAYITE